MAGNIAGTADQPSVHKLIPWYICLALQSVFLVEALLQGPKRHTCGHSKQQCPLVVSFLIDTLRHYNGTTEDCSAAADIGHY